MVDLFIVNSHSELPEILRAVSAQQSASRKEKELSLSERGWERRLIKRGHCSALVRVSAGNKDLLVGHTPWSDYSQMTRIFKYYHFNLPDSWTQASVIGFSNGDGKVSLEEFDAGLHPKTRQMLEAKLDNGFNFDPAKWAESAPKVDLSKAFACFDTSGDGFLDLDEMKRAFRAIGFKKLEVTDDIFKSFDSNGDGRISWEEFRRLLDIPEAYAALSSVNVDPETMVDMAEDYFFDATRFNGKH